MAVQTRTFNYTGTYEKFNVPAGVKTIDVTLRGAGSATRQGGLVTGKVRVDGNDTLLIMVGRAGQLNDGVYGGGNAFGGGGSGGRGWGGKDGGNGGGGASAIRKERTDGPIWAVAGGAGGDAGDGGNGGAGGATIGGEGQPGTSGADPSGNATGGTQSQPGKAGISSAGADWKGNNGEPGRLARGGHGGSASGTSHGGGGGGGGFYAGGGGQAGKFGIAPAGGGAGGSNFTGGLYSITSERGTGGTGNGQVVLSWLDPDDPNNPPTPPENITIDGHPIADELATKAVHSVVVKGTPDDPNSGNGVRMHLWLSQRSDFPAHQTWNGTYDATEHRDKVTITGLQANTHYYLRIYTQDNHGLVSQNYRATNFWTNRRPNLPTLTQPAENEQVTTLVNVTFIWNHTDPDPSDPQTAFELRYRTAGSPIDDPGDWVSVGEHTTSFEQWTINAGTFKGNNFYEWQVRTKDAQDAWSEWSLPNSFYVTAEATPPILQEPLNGTAVIAAAPYRFRWKFLTPDKSVVQTKADLRYRVWGTTDWTVISGDETDPGSNKFMDVPADTFEPGFLYEWQARTFTSAAVWSDWSNSGGFWTVLAPGSGPGVTVIESGKPAQPLGQGHNRAYVYERGGQVLRGELTPLTTITWGRKRDDISHTVFHMDNWDSDMGAFLGELRTWMFEIVVFRDGERVWEGPITRISASKDTVEIEAQDVMVYPYRRILRQGYNDSYRVMDGLQLGQHTVVERSAQIIMNALAYDDPNVLQYLTPLNNPFDATQSRVVKDFSRTAWEEIDDLAATAGLDYTTAGRRIILWDTHRAIGKLPEMRDGDFADSPVVTEYGMSAADFFAVTNNNGIRGADSRGLDASGQPPAEIGWLEQLASAYGESQGAGTEQTLTREAKKKLEATLREQAERNIAGRYPAPLVVRVPDNTTLNPMVNIGINQLIPGVWIPLRSTGTIREVSQWQKLDSMSVTEDSSGEKITVVMSPAPNGGQDPDADAAAEEDA